MCPSSIIIRGALGKHWGFLLLLRQGSRPLGEHRLKCIDFGRIGVVAAIC